jgi:GAF domain-containing protein
LSNDLQFLQAGMKFLAESQDLNATIHRIVELAANACGSNMGTLCLVDRTEQVLKPFAAVGLPDAYLEGCGRIGVGEQCCGRAALHRVPWVVEDMRTDPLFKVAADNAAKVGVRAAFSVPVLDAHGECIAVLASHFHERYRPTEYTLERARLFAQLIAFALAKYNTEQALGVAAD